MLPRQHRLPLRTELKQVKKEGKLFQGRLSSLLISNQRPEIRLQPSRFAFIVSKKIHKKATKRNRVKRLLSEVVYQFLPRIKPGLDIVFLAKKAIVGQELVGIQKEVKKLFVQAGVVAE